jgi:uncharacterized protein DUF6542
LHRTSAELRLLVDSSQVTLTVAGFVALALPWWSYVSHGTSHARTGWDALGSGEYGHGWGLIAAIGSAAVATLVRRRGLHWTAVVLGVLGAVVVLVGAANEQHGDSGGVYANGHPHAHAGLWLGGVLALLVAANQLLATLGERQVG